MINDKFNSGSKNDFKNKFRDRKFVSAVAIGIFVLILLIVLVAKGCGSRNPQKPIQVRPQEHHEDDYPEVAIPPQNVEEEEGKRLLREGQEYYNGDGGRLQSYVEAEKCFIEAKKLGVRDADVWLKKCAQKLAPKPAPAPKKPVVKPAPKPAPKKPAVKPAPKPAPKKPVVKPAPKPAPKKPAAKPAPKPAPKKPAARPANTNNANK